MGHSCRCFIFDETPAGVDVGTKREVYGLLCRAVEWRSDPLISSYLTEVYESAIAVLSPVADALPELSKTPVQSARTTSWLPPLTTRGELHF